jgi:hypothetical protein
MYIKIVPALPPLNLLRVESAGRPACARLTLEGSSCGRKCQYGAGTHTLAASTACILCCRASTVLFGRCGAARARSPRRIGPPGWAGPLIAPVAKYNTTSREDQPSFDPSHAANAAHVHTHDNDNDTAATCMRNGSQPLEHRPRSEMELLSNGTHLFPELCESLPGLSALVQTLRETLHSLETLQLAVPHLLEVRHHPAVVIIK